MRERGAASAFLRTHYNPLSVRETRVTNTDFRVRDEIFGSGGLARRRDPVFFAFDLLYLNGKDLRYDQLSDRKSALRQVLNSQTSTSALQYADDVSGSGVALYQRVCEMDLEGIVAKHASDPGRSNAVHDVAGALTFRGSPSQPATGPDRKRPHSLACTAATTPPNPRATSRE